MMRPNADSTTCDCQRTERIASSRNDDVASGTWLLHRTVSVPFPSGPFGLAPRLGYPRSPLSRMALRRAAAVSAAQGPCWRLPRSSRGAKPAPAARPARPPGLPGDPRHGAL